MNAGLQREALRQQMLLRALWRDAPPAVVEGWLRGEPAARRRGLQAYQAHAGALAERALGAAHPTVEQLIGAEGFAALARAYWQADPPQHGDVATWGGGLADFIAADAQLADEPCLADMARLDWAVHRAASAADDDAAPQGLSALAGPDAVACRLHLRQGWAVLQSAHPVHAIWHAHQCSDADRFDDVRQAFAEGRADAVRVRRQGPRVVVERLPPATACFEAALLQAAALGPALQAAGEGFDFEDWLIHILRLGGLSAVGDAIQPEGNP